MSGPDPQLPSPAPSEAAPEPVRPALAAFERGDFAAAAATAGALLASDPSPQVQAATRALLDRLAPDAWAQRLALLATALLALLIGLYVL